MKKVHAFSIVAESNQFLAAGIAATLREHPAIGMVSLVASREELQDALETCVAVDLLLVDEAFFGGHANGAVAALVANHPEMSVIVLLDHIDTFKINDLIGSGAKGIVHKASSTAELHGAVSIALSGYSHATQTAASKPVPSPQTPAVVQGANGLTARQNQVIALMANGASNKEIARKLGISEATVKVHVATIFKRFGVHNRTSAVAQIHSI
jgi:DNA-binding NarL/FixJ family response regulator